MPVQKPRWRYICKMNKVVTSLQNPLIKRFASLTEKSRERSKTGLFTIEGVREAILARKAGCVLKTVLICPEIAGAEVVRKFERTENETFGRVKISTQIYKKLAYRSTTEGVLAIAEIKKLELKDISFKTENPLILVAEATEKPGNIGALLRTADAAGVDAVLIANPKTDLYNPNTIRSSVGCIFTNQVAVGTTAAVIQFLKQRGCAIYCAAPHAALPYHGQDFTRPSAIVVGAEATGLSTDWLRNSSQNITIPMQGEIDSVNVSVAAGILIFEAKRQRGLKI
ncbi:MAG: TrmH family RNA methyltransferase [Marinirhabdus sp.]